MTEELQSRTQQPDESLIEYIRSTQEVMRRAIPGSLEGVARVLRQCHQRYGVYLHSRTYGFLEELAREARCIEEHMVVER